MNLLFKYATRSRPEKFQEGLDSIYKNLSNPEDVSVLISIDNDDRTMDKYRLFNNVFSGISSNKIEAINRDIEEAEYIYPNQYDWSILICMSDDMRFITKGFDDIIRQDMQRHFPDLDGVLHYSDGIQGKNCMTLSIIGREYYERDNFIYDPRFESLWCDVVSQEVAQIRGKYKYMGDNNILFNHLHPSFGLCEYDEQYRKTEAMEVRKRDYETYLKVKQEYDPTNIFPIRSI